LWSDDIPYEQDLIVAAGRIRSNDVDRTAAVVDAGENLSRSLRVSLTADEEHSHGGESTRDDANVRHGFFPLRTGQQRTGRAKLMAANLMAKTRD
jgi:hypothetical protein